VIGEFLGMVFFFGANVVILSFKKKHPKKNTKQNGKRSDIVLNLQMNRFSALTVGDEIQTASQVIRVCVCVCMCVCVCLFFCVCVCVCVFT